MDLLDSPRPHFSVVLPVYNEAGTIPELYRRLSAVLDDMGESWEMVFVDDGSRDDSYTLLAELNQRDPRVTVLKFSRNFGHHIAMTAGLDKAAGDFVVMMDSDLQDRPEEIPRLYHALLEQDADIAVAIRRNKKFGPIKRLNSAIFHAVMRRVFTQGFKGGVFRVMRRKVVLEVRRCREAERLLVGLIDWTGFHTTTLEVEHAERFAGETKYSFFKQIQLSLNSITSFTTIPLKLASYVGFFISFCAFLGAGWFAFRKLAWGLGVPGWASIMVAVFFMGGVQLLSLGILGEYVGRIFNATRNRPLYIVDRHLRDERTLATFVEPSPAESEPSPAESEPSPAESEPSSAERKPSSGDSEPSSGDSEPSSADREALAAEHGAEGHGSPPVPHLDEPPESIARRPSADA